MDDGSRQALEAVDAGGDAGGSKAVVNVDDGDVGSAGIEHAEKRGNPTEAGAVADAGGHGNHRSGDQAADHAWERTFHARNANDDAGLGEFAFTMLKQAMNAGDTDVVELIDAVAHHTRGEQGFFRDWDVASPGGNDENQAFASNFTAALDSDDAGE